MSKGQSPHSFVALGLLDSPREVGPSRVLVMPGISINREVTSLFITHSLTLSCSAIAEEEEDTGAGRKRLLLSGDHLTIFGFQFWF